MPISRKVNVLTYSVQDRLGLSDRFDRWRFLQRLLDEETTSARTNEILYVVLDGYLKYQRPKYKESEETGSPELTPDRRATIEYILQCANGTVPVLTESNAADDAILEQLEALLPDMVEDEDAVKGIWDTVLELHGREGVKINEQNATPAWKARCLIARVLLHHDFLILGLVDSPLI
jgi:hypothetical protein